MPELKKKRDILPFFVVFLLLCGGLLGCLAIYNARITEQAALYFALRQLGWLGAGTLVLIFFFPYPFPVLQEKCISFCRDFCFTAAFGTFFRV